MATKAYKVSAVEAARRITLTVTVVGTRQLAFRIWLGSKFIKFGAWIIGMPCVVESGPQAEVPDGQ